MALVLAYAVLAGPQLLVNMVTLFTARNHLVNDLLGNVAPVLLEFHGFEYWLQLFYAVYFQAAAEFEQQLNIPHAQLYVLGTEIVAEIIIQVGSQLVLGTELCIFVPYALIARVLQALQGNFPGKDQAVQLVQNRQLLIGQGSLQGL